MTYRRIYVILLKVIIIVWNYRIIFVSDARRIILLLKIV